MNKSARGYRGPISVSIDIAACLLTKYPNGRLAALGFGLTMCPAIIGKSAETALFLVGSGELLLQFMSVTQSWPYGLAEYISVAAGIALIAFAAQRKWRSRAP